ncbi:tRNA (guanine-N(7)-)-methyltransferase-like [Rattus norvegicus]|uniref:tRNA (guanine-N(7)-)-methyltransferase-like n=1 Tax=Rattus norvegicus TaxID=10116 RepID=UPI002FD7D5C6
MKGRESFNHNQPAPDKADGPAAATGTRDWSVRKVPAPECRQLAAAGRAEAGAGRRAGPLGAGPPRAPPVGHAGLRRARGLPLARRPRHLFGRAGRRFRSLSRPATGSRAPGPEALGRLRPPYLTSAAALSRPSQRRGGERPPTLDLRCPGPPQHRQGLLARAARGRPDHPPAAAAEAGPARVPAARSRSSLRPSPPRGLATARLQRSRHPRVSES